MNLKKKILSLINILKETDIDEIEISSFWGAQKIRVSNNKKYDKDVIITSNIKQPEEVNKQSNSNKNLSDNLDENKNKEDFHKLIKIKAPLVGTYYNLPKPDSKPFINIGDRIEKGQTICIIEAMKIFNEIESDYSGKVVDILVDNATPVEFDQDLIIIKQI